MVQISTIHTVVPGVTAQVTLHEDKKFASEFISIWNTKHSVASSMLICILAQALCSIRAQHFKQHWLNLGRAARELETKDRFNRNLESIINKIW